jgi:lipopolysaccharide biosynthesis glycosyltransferase
MINIFVGYDPREASAYHTFCDSVLRRASEPVSFTPLTPGLCGIAQMDASNTFSYQRFLVPHLMNYRGHAMFLDGDMICNADIAELWAMRPILQCAVACVQHDYQTRAKVKYLGNKNEDYPRKNWSSVMIFNCENKFSQSLTPELIKKSTGQYLHRFQWCPDASILNLPAEWNHLVGEFPPRPAAKLLHYTLGTPCFADYARGDHADDWRREFAQACRPVPQFFAGAT